MEIFLSVYFILMSGIFGVVIGSFLNVVIYRLPAGRTIVKGHSMCMTCGHNLAAKDLIPIISWASLHGKCRYCGAPIASRYTKIESFTGISFLIASIGIYKYASPAIVNLGFNLYTFFMLYFVSYVLCLAAVISAMMIYFDTGKGFAATAVWSGICGALSVSLPHIFIDTIDTTRPGFDIMGLLTDAGTALLRLAAVAVITFVLFKIFGKEYSKDDLCLDITLGVIPLYGFFYMFANRWIEYGIYAVVYGIIRAIAKSGKYDKYIGIVTVCALQLLSVIHIIYMGIK